MIRAGQCLVLVGFHYDPICKIVVRRNGTNSILGFFEMWYDLACIGFHQRFYNLAGVLNPKGETRFVN